MRCSNAILSLLAAKSSRKDDFSSIPLKSPPTTAQKPSTRRNEPLQVFVRDNNVDQALKVLKKKMQREGVFREMKRRRFYEKPSERTTRQKAEALRRVRKLARKQAVREGLIAAPVKKVLGAGRAGGYGASSARR
jgi:small subunit ribosomal protein S21